MAKFFLYNNGTQSDEYESAKRLKQILESELSSLEGSIWIIPSVNIHSSTGYHDIDLLVIGYLNEYFQDVLDFQDIEIKSFCIIVEIKSHGADGIYRVGQDLYVKYTTGDHNVTKQSDGQSISLRRFLSESIQLNKKRLPFVSNIIWLTGIDNDDFCKSVNLYNSNIITSDVTAKSFFETVGRQFKLVDLGFIDAFKSYSHNDIETVANIFCAKNDGVDTMSLRRFNILRQDAKFLTSIEKNTNPIIVISGRAGTGKTMMLLQAADYLMRKGHKCIFLTYNTALISDLKHTMDCIPQKFSDIKMESMHSFLLSVFYKNGLWKNNYDIESNFMQAAQSSFRIKDRLIFNSEYDYVFIDEAQDWERPIPDILKTLFRNSHIVIADGVDQFMRASEHTDWGIPLIPERKKCLRQRRNLTLFVKLFANKLGVHWNVEVNNDFPGGRVLVYNKYTADVHNELLTDAKTHGCAEYDMMLLVPKSMVADDGSFSLLNKYSENGINLYDGVNKKNRDTIYGKENSKNKECRVYTYESCRGLEAWTTVCLRFDEIFTEEHPHDYHEIEYSMARKYMLTLWSLIPLTRAIDTLVLVVNNKDSYISKILEDLSMENSDIVTYIK